MARGAGPVNHDGAMVIVAAPPGQVIASMSA
jgi:hypothetical protein